MQKTYLQQYIPYPIFYHPPPLPPARRTVDSSTQTSEATIVNPKKKATKPKSDNSKRGTPNDDGKPSTQKEKEINRAQKEDDTVQPKDDTQKDEYDISGIPLLVSQGPKHKQLDQYQLGHLLAIQRKQNEREQLNNTLRNTQDSDLNSGESEVFYTDEFLTGGGAGGGESDDSDLDWGESKEETEDRRRKRNAAAATEKVLADEFEISSEEEEVKKPKEKPHTILKMLLKSANKID